MTNFSFTNSSSASSEQENDTKDFWDLCLNQGYKNREGENQLPIFIFICVTCILGLLGNGAVIWLLAFRMKRTHFTVYILNLAIADFGVLTSSLAVALSIVNEGFSLFILLFVGSVVFYCAYSTSQFLLTAISIDRCMAGLFPLWYRFRRPEKLSTILCAIIWVLSVLIQVPCHSFWFLYPLFWNTPLLPPFYAFLVNAVVCLPLITVSTLILFVRFCFKSQQLLRGKLLTAILLALFFFLIFGFPLNIIHLIELNPKSSEDFLNIMCYNVIEYGVLCAALNSFVNPLLYFFVGRKKGGLCRENLRLVLQRVFMEEDKSCTNPVEPETPLADLQQPPPQGKFELRHTCGPLISANGYIHTSTN